MQEAGQRSTTGGYIISTETFTPKEVEQLCEILSREHGIVGTPSPIGAPEKQQYRIRIAPREGEKLKALIAPYITSPSFYYKVDSAKPLPTFVGAKKQGVKEQAEFRASPTKASLASLIFESGTTPPLTYKNEGLSVGIHVASAEEAQELLKEFESVTGFK